MSDEKQEELYVGVCNAITKHMVDTYGPPKPGDNLPARMAVALLQLSAVYFVETKAPKDVIRDFVNEAFGLEQENRIITGADIVRPIRR